MIWHVEIEQIHSNQILSLLLVAKKLKFYIVLYLIEKSKVSLFPKADSSY